MEPRRALLARGPSNRNMRGNGLGLALAVSLLLPVPAPAALPWSTPFEIGERVIFEGTVVDLQGTPLGGVEVRLEASHPGAFDFLKFRRQASVLKEERTLTDANGRFRLEWVWEQEMRRFEVVAAVRDRGPSGPRLHELTRKSIRDRLRWGSPVVVTLVVEQADFVRKLQQFEAGIQTSDERSIYESWGRPDHVERKLRPDLIEVSWWYYELGRVARFHNGKLVESEEFPPVPARRSS